MTPDELSSKYYELLYAVECKNPGESRHETALRYIREAESTGNKESEPEAKNQIRKPING